MRRPFGQGLRCPATPLLALAVSLALLDLTLSFHLIDHAAPDLGMNTGARTFATFAVYPLLIAPMLAMGNLGDRIGHRQVLLAGLAGLVGAGLLTAAAPGPGVLLAGRLVTGLCLSAVMVAAFSLLPREHRHRSMRRAVSVVLCVQSVVWLASILLTGPLVDRIGWRAGALAVPLAAAVLAAAAATGLPRGRPAGRPDFRRADGIALVLATVGLLALTAALTWAPERGWADPAILTLYGAAAVLLSALVVLGRRSTGFGIPTDLLRARPFWRALVLGLGLYFCVAAASQQIPALATNGVVVSWSPPVVLSAIVCGSLIGAVVGGRARMPAVRMAVIGLGLGCAGYGIAGVLIGASDTVLLVGLVTAALGGFGVALAALPQFATMLNAVPESRPGAVACMLPIVVQLGTVAGYAVSQPLADAFAGARPGLLTADGALAGFQGVMWACAALFVLMAVLLIPLVVSMSLLVAAAIQVALARGVGDLDLRHRAWIGGATALAGLSAALLSGRQLKMVEELRRNTAVAETLRRAVVHPLPRRAGCLRAAGLYRPALTEAGVGGDLCEIVDTPHGSRVLLGDVRGSGLDAVHTMARLLGAYRALAQETATLGELAAQLDRQLGRDADYAGDTELFATAVLLEQPAGTADVELLNLGHLDPLVLGPLGVRPLGSAQNLPLGFGGLRREPYRGMRVEMADDETLLLFTDGLAEARDGLGHFYPVTDRLTAAGSREPDRVVAFLDDDLRRHQTDSAQENPPDDVTILALRRDP